MVNGVGESKVGRCVGVGWEVEGDRADKGGGL